jgi:hypothetical protein
MELARFLLSDTPFYFLYLFFFLHLILAEFTLMLHRGKSIQHSFLAFGLLMVSCPYLVAAFCIYILMLQHIHP